MRMNNAKIIFWFGLFLILSAAVNARTPAVEIKKTAPSEIGLDEILEVSIEIVNSYNETLSITLTEIVDFAEPIDKENLIQQQNITQKDNGTVIINGITWLKADSICEIGCKKDDKICDPDCKCVSANDPDCAAFVAPIAPRYEWVFVLQSGEKKKLSYRVKPYKIGFINIPKTVAETSIGTFYSNELRVRVKCKIDKICSSDENSYNCPEDCESGGTDNYCDGVKDGICDPDCPKYADSDCNPTICGDGKCETEKNESYENCPQDCEKTIVCGDSSCDENENFANCMEDCQSGGSDNYCDGVKDSRCDPDCARNLDYDCLCNNDGACDLNFENFSNCSHDCPQPISTGPNYLLYIILFIVAIFVVSVIYRRLKTRNEEEE